MTAKDINSERARSGSAEAILKMAAGVGGTTLKVLESNTAALERLFRGSGLTAIANGSLTSIQCAYVLGQYDSYVGTFPRLLCAAGAKVKDDRVRMPLIHNLWDEHGNGKIEGSHRTLYKKLLSRLEAAEPSLAPTLSLRPAMAVSTYSAACMGELDSGDDMFAVGFMGPGTEAVTVELYRVLKNLLAGTNSRVSDNFFELHTQLDEAHARYFDEALALALASAESSGSSLRAVISGCRRALELEGDFWDAIVSEARQTV